MENKKIEKRMKELSKATDKGELKISFPEDLDEFEDLLYEYAGKVRREMNDNYFRFVELERKFQELTSKFCDIKIKRSNQKGAADEV